MKLAEPALTPATFEQWMDALESGAYPKCSGELRDDIDPESFEPVYGYCCLGVLADIEGVQWDRLDDYDDLGVSDNEYHGAPGGELRGFLGSKVGQIGPGLAERVIADLIQLNDTSHTFAPVIARARHLYAEWKQAQA